MMSTATKQLLMDWKCEENVVGMFFDTTSSNTGQKAGACISLQKEFGYKNHFSKLVGYNDKNKYYYPTMPGVFKERQPAGDGQFLW
ncbi:uncharacterized protein LOC143031670 isoform X2 [Oratosquilla oratoria]|uniref:uncharacterized protein LOC143031670 isoform X2 n=1 Tax=Oratosquilla oratoria TaxID=337810 RepID=UPI003F7745CA